MPETLPTQVGYDRWADIYDHEDNPLILLEEPHARDLIGDVRRLDVVDLGCGTGRHTYWLAAAGAFVTAVDFSRGMLAKARRKPGCKSIRFVEHDLAYPLPCEDATFDRILCSLVVDHISKLIAFFCELRRICRPSGAIVISVIHPAMRLRGLQARFYDHETGGEIRPSSCHHSIDDYIAASTHAGLRIAQLSEHTVREDLAARSPRAGKYMGWPLLLIMRLLYA